MKNTFFCDSPEYVTFGIHQSAKRLSIENITRDPESKIYFVDAELTQLDSDETDNVILHLRGTRSEVITALAGAGEPFTHGESMQEWTDTVQACVDVMVM